ncbi:hypothetical protein IWX47DRAFT_871610, partial [Phyllosticta citricarpa]
QQPRDLGSNCCNVYPTHASSLPFLGCCGLAPGWIWSPCTCVRACVRISQPRWRSRGIRLAGCLSPPAGNSHVFMSIALTTTISQQPLRAPTTIRGVPGAMVPAAAMLTARPLAKFWLHTPAMHMRVIWLHDPHGTDVGGLGRGVWRRRMSRAKTKLRRMSVHHQACRAAEGGGEAWVRLGMVFVSRVVAASPWLGLAMPVFQSLRATSRADQTGGRRYRPEATLPCSGRDGRCG